MSEKPVPKILMPIVFVGAVIKVAWDALKGGWSRRNEDKE